MKLTYTIVYCWGDHEMWRNGSTSVVITKTCEVSPKVTRDALNAIEKVKGYE
ncbi:putative toxin-antitoxin system, toxin component, HicA family [Mobiluncus mulieris 28-1]|uniref:hypothetical protein n=1 Tax=Mobiluncus mulieris TaxID=2052 RepID=UPI0001BE7D34|nr:hypothetical protein [Mobiluncus mulieris]EEZ90653.1 putative toxin-antitoxin system, toxin component, HicA family [Mobiluncus mulieris 28-1]